MGAGQKDDLGTMVRMGWSNFRTPILVSPFAKYSTPPRVTTTEVSSNRPRTRAGDRKNRTASPLDFFFGCEQHNVRQDENQRHPGPRCDPQKRVDQRPEEDQVQIQRDLDREEGTGAARRGRCFEGGHQLITEHNNIEALQGAPSSLRNPVRLAG